MPLNRKADQEARILQAIEAIYNNVFLSICTTVCIYDVLYTTLTMCFCEQSTYQQSQMKNQKLLSTEEEVLLQ